MARQPPMPPANDIDFDDEDDTRPDTPEEHAQYAARQAVARNEANMLAAWARDVAADPEIDGETIARVRRAYLAAHYPQMHGDGMQARRQYAFVLVNLATCCKGAKQWSRTRSDDEVTVAIVGIVSALADALDEWRFLHLPIDADDVRAMRTRTTTGFVAWLILRTGAFGEKCRVHPDQDDVNELARQLRRDRQAIIKKL